MDCISNLHSLFWLFLRALRDLRGASGFPSDVRIVDGTTTKVTKSTKSGLRKACPDRIPLSIRDSSHSRCPASFAVYVFFQGRQRRLECSSSVEAASRRFCTSSEVQQAVTEESSSIAAMRNSEGDRMPPRLSLAFVSRRAHFAILVFFPKLTLRVFRFRGIFRSNCDANRMRWLDFPA